MIFTDGVVSLKHLVSMEILSNEEVLGLIKRGLAFKEKRSNFRWTGSTLLQIYFLNHPRGRINLLKWQRKSWDLMLLNLMLRPAP